MSFISFSYALIKSYEIFIVFELILRACINLPEQFLNIDFAFLILYHYKVSVIFRACRGEYTLELDIEF